MQSYFNVSLVTLLIAAVYFWMATRVSRLRVKVGILPPVMTGDPVLERTIRAHLNTLEWLPIFLPSLWLFAIYWDANVAAALGLVWLVGRIVATCRRLKGAFPAFSFKRLPSGCCSLEQLGASPILSGLQPPPDPIGHRAG
jgi:uncharacterized membrane protein YecN with MAPEG domain